MIRVLEDRDISACHSIVRENWDAGVANKFLIEVDHALHDLCSYTMEWPPEYFVIEEDGEVVAFAGMMWSWIMSGVMDFIWINVKREHQGFGHGAALTEHRIKLCQERGVKVINLMTQKPDWFRAYGFVSTHEYDGGWYSMTRQLAPLDIHYD